MGLGRRRKFKRKLIRDRDLQCVYCDEKLTVSTATMDHLVPISKGGKLTNENIVIACERCNQIKNDIPAATIEEGRNLIRKILEQS